MLSRNLTTSHHHEPDPLNEPPLKTKSSDTQQAPDLLPKKAKSNAPKDAKYKQNHHPDKYQSAPKNEDT